VVAEKLRQRIESGAFGAPQRIPLTASFGVAPVHGAEGFAEALRRADAALYRAKSRGRNRVVVDDELEVDATAGSAADAA
jgi:diguanylate cyclase (GGDEF)-like protein